MPGSLEAKEHFAEFEASLAGDEKNTNDVVISQKLAAVKVAARDPSSAPFVYCRHGISQLAEAAFDDNRMSKHPLTSLEASRIVANALLLRPAMQQILVECIRPKQILDFYKQPDSDHEFLGGRTLFLLTYQSTLDFVDLVESEGMIGYICQHLDRHVDSVKKVMFDRSPMNAMALGETLKLLYNITSKYSAQMHFFTQAFQSLANILVRVPSPSNPSEPPMGQLINALAAIDWPVNSEIQDNELLLKLSRKLVIVLDQLTSQSDFSAPKSESVLVSLITVARRIYELSDDEANQYLSLALLPQDSERDKPLGQSSTLASRVLRLQTSAGLNVLPEAVSGLLFDLSDRDAAKFVHNIGYGHAAGYLMTHKIPIPEGLGKSPNGGSRGSNGVAVNPVTGQRTDTEQPVNMPEMTDAEKEREAERLFVLFERLKATGVMNVENPLRTAQQSGRFEELSSDSD